MSVSKGREWWMGGGREGQKARHNSLCPGPWSPFESEWWSRTMEGGGVGWGDAVRREEEGGTRW